ncbi:hypothetical protein IE81DRAFT_346417 [Ceraceosorus guamensis]|uniref:Uncharacterized protein n=1 Tax=Ceraceosorus guamensis TaxID=1522189 RepID=A0A316W6E2_9BASI|nr:hypothetical protein IE81DRAFT_346417 [Ceraceosorus guamensis]PWN43613.1 hypothetical protein IE81DRAFT_346417 [Ceraceosorus guamensis]
MATTEIQPPSLHDVDSYVPRGLVRTGTLFIIVYSNCTALLFILLSTMLFRYSFSEERKRKLPILVVLSLSMVLGLFGSILNTVFWATLLLRDRDEDGSAINAASYWCLTTAMLFVTPLVAHVAVVLRIVSFYPPMLAGARKRLLVIAPPMILKIARVPFIGLYLREGYQSVAARGGAAAFDNGLSQTWDNRWPTVEFALTVVDSLYCFAVLLRKFHQLGNETQHHRNALLDRRRGRVVDAIQQFFAGVGFTFAFPTIYNIAVLTCIAMPSYRVSPTNNGFLLVSNVFVQVFGATLACTNASAHWRDDRFVNGTPVSRNSWAARAQSMADVEGGFASTRRPPKPVLITPNIDTPSEMVQSSFGGNPFERALARMRSRNFEGHEAVSRVATRQREDEGAELRKVLSQYSGPAVAHTADAGRREGNATGRRPRTGDSDHTLFGASPSRRGSACKNSSSPTTSPALAQDASPNDAVASLRLDSRRPSESTLFGSPSKASTGDPAVGEPPFQPTLPPTRASDLASSDVQELQRESNERSVSPRTSTS